MNDIIQLKSNLIVSCVHALEHCRECAEACQKMLGMESCVKVCGRCIDACKDCIYAFETCADNRGELLVKCKEACEACIEVCGNHKHEHCQKCAESCRICLEECENMML